jgi:hypothetical protein
MNSAAVQSQREINVAALTETASVMFAIYAMLAHPRGQLKMPRLDAYCSRATVYELFLQYTAWKLWLEITAHNG